MRRIAAPSEIGQLAAPLATLVDGAWRRMHWWIATMAVLYALSGITIVKPDEVAVILRWGRLVGDTPALQTHGAGLLFAFPRPMDQVLRVQTKHVSEVTVSTLSAGSAPEFESDPLSGAGVATLDPISQGYALTGDENIVHVDVVARYRIKDPAQWAFYGPPSDDILRVEVTAAMIRSLGEMGVDRVLSDGRKDLIVAATRRAQAGLDAAHAGLELASLELTRLSPPTALAPDFTSVQSAFIEAETKRKSAQAVAEQAVPDATARVDAALQDARATSAAELALARGDAQAFRALDHEYRANPMVVRERLYRDGVERAMSATNIRWVPPPVGGSYHGMRVTIRRPGATTPAPPYPDEEPPE